MSENKKNRVIKKVNPVKQWPEGLVLPFLKDYGISATGAGGGALSFLLNHGAIGWGFMGLAASGIVGVSTAAITIRRYRIKTSSLGARFHEFSHDIREYLPDLAKRTRDRVKLNAEVKRFWGCMAQHAAEYFSTVLHNQTGNAGCMVWLRNENVYQLVGIGGSITTDADIATIPADVSRGVVRVLVAEMKQRGVFIIDDVDEALRDDEWIRVGLENYIQSMAVTGSDFLYQGL